MDFLLTANFCPILKKLGENNYLMRWLFSQSFMRIGKNWGFFIDGQLFSVCCFLFPRLYWDKIYSILDNKKFTLYHSSLMKPTIVEHCEYGLGMLFRSEQIIHPQALDRYSCFVWELFFLLIRSLLPWEPTFTGKKSIYSVVQLRPNASNFAYYENEGT